MYTANIKNLLDLFESELPAWNSTSTASTYLFNGYDGKILEDGKYQLTLNVLGHNPKNIKLEVTDTQILIKSKKEEGSSSLVKDIDLTFALGKDYDGTKSEAKFDNGLLIITTDKRDEAVSYTHLRAHETN
jgi:HSP20 family molecular chaperone IbpA